MLLQATPNLLDLGQILLIIFVLAPGYVAYQSIYLISNISIVEDGIDKYLFTIVGGLLSVSLLFVILAWKYSIQTIENALASDSIVNLLIWVGPAIIIGLILGVLVGLIVDKWIKAGVDSSRFRIWDRAYTLVDDPVEGEIVTTDGYRITGQVDKFGTINEEKDLLVRYPQVVDSETGEEVDVDDRDYLYIGEDSISHVIFDELDLDQFPDELVEQMKS